MKVEAVIWDIYGTILYSANMEIPVDPGKYSKFKKGFQRIGDFLNLEIDPDKGEKLYRNLVKELQKRKKKKNENIISPEINIIKLWDIFMKKKFQKNFRRATLEKIAIIFEKAVNPVEIGKNVEKILNYIRSKNLYQGIMSNAQFYTKRILNDFLERSFDYYFNSDLVFFSYKIGISKPDPQIYELLEKKLNYLSVKNKNCLIIGNDEDNDIIPLSKRGFKSIYISPKGKDSSFSSYSFQNIDGVLAFLKKII